MPESQTVWKSDNQGAKETFIQTRRRGRDGQLEWKGLGARCSWRSWASKAVAGGVGGPTFA